MHNNSATKPNSNTYYLAITILNFFLLSISIAVHCYACDEEIKDSRLKEHLANFGINIARLEKTEKSIAELVNFLEKAYKPTDKFIEEGYKTYMMLNYFIFSLQI